jgi:ubiquinone/menaquinone biosynthesis C-methylase UbiE
MIEVDKNLKAAYDNHYSDKTEAWRRIGAKGKAENIIEITKNCNFNSIIEVGAGDGNILLELSKKNFCKNYAAAEISDSAIEQIKKKAITGLNEIVQFDGYKLPFADEAFDLAICSHVIEHVEHPRILLREIKRISKAQVFEVPIDFSLNVDQKVKHFTAYGHINIYTPSLFRYLLLSEGFTITKGINRLYSNDVIGFHNKKTSVKYMAHLTKKMIWNVFPFLKKHKPNTYTVLTNLG